MSSPSNTKATVKRYRINPVELFIFIGVSSGFGYSVVNLFNQTETFQVAALQPMNSQPNRALIAHIGEIERMPASETGSAPTIENPAEGTTPAGRVFESSPRYNPTEIR